MDEKITQVNGEIKLLRATEMIHVWQMQLR